MLTKEEVYAMGFSRGQEIARHVPYLEKGPLDSNTARELGITDVESLADVEMVFYHHAGESESCNRDYSPFEFTAKELNDLEQEVEWEVWDVYNDAIQEGFKTVWEQHEAAYRKQGFK